MPDRQYPDYNKAISFSEYSKSDDISRTVSRGLIYSYCANTQIPIVFRHYSHKSRVFGEFIGGSSPEHCSIFFYLSGDFQFITGNDMYTLNYGDVFVANDHDKFLCKTGPKCVFNYYEINIPLSFFENVFCPEFFRKIFYDRGHMKNHIRLTTKQVESCINRLIKIEDLVAKPSAQNDMTAYSYFIQIMSILNESVASPQEIPTPTYAPDCVLKALDYIHKNFLEIQNLDELTKYSHTSAVYLRKKFKECTGYTLSDYVRNIKISYAKKLLRSDMSVTTIAYEVGFGSPSHFIETFKNQTGMTPLKYKHMYTKKDE